MAQLFSLGDIAHLMKLLPLLLCASVCFACFSMAFRGFSARGIPVTRTRMMTGLPAVITGIICALLGLYFLICSIAAVRLLFYIDVRT